MSKTDAIAYYERILLLRVQLFLRAVIFAGTLLIFSKLYYSQLMEKPIEYLNLQDSYAAALVIVFSVSSAAATIDLPIRYVYRKIRIMLSRKVLR